MVKFSPRVLLLLVLLLLLPSLAAANNADPSAPYNSASHLRLSGKISSDVEANRSAAKKITSNTIAKRAGIFYLGDSYLDDGNYEGLTGAPEEYFSNQPPWGTDVNVTLGLTAVGRWSAAGSPPNPLGNNYAVNGAGIEGCLTPVDSSFRAQVNLMLSDYPNGLPSNTLVVVAIGSNDVVAAMNWGGIWSTNLSGWRLNNSGFTVPAVGSTVTVTVANSKGLVAGSNNRVIFPNSPSLTMMAVTAVDKKASTVTLTTVIGSTTGINVSPNDTFEMAAAYLFDLGVPVFTQCINALLTDGAKVVLVLPQRTDLLPLYDQTTDQTLAYSTWQNLYARMSAAIPSKDSHKSTNISSFDLNGFFDWVFFRYPSYGFLYNYPGWNNNPNVGANEYMFWDFGHPSGAMHQLIANDFIEFLNQAIP